MITAVGKARTFVKENELCRNTHWPLESETLWRRSGAFTGAIANTGRLELADQGTLFSMKQVTFLPKFNPKLLRALQERIQRLGNTYTQKGERTAGSGDQSRSGEDDGDSRIRSDLYYRLNVFPIRIPPLWERPEDIPLLVRDFADKFGGRCKSGSRAFRPTPWQSCKRWHWPGNVRELEQPHRTGW